ncbi:AAA family ATPase [Planomicrobium okeanokoites]|uniref:Nuclease SbcCD subunit C n=1 Tax=Planomicrobium okeanokoites TaxID=244 RepID=A0ABV7KH30_PLAOK|nr:AAA family ATPase [Planomicrobium okeanokoites]TAA68902.1 SMC family ATPase [Planomicrobium okeanokoites]
MRPLKLKLTAFGPYKETETIDFNDLRENRLFVISGSTGAGKTTIFDGISFALYGGASGSDRSETRNLRSDFADDAVHTCVEMEFEIHNQRYRILRQMPHVKKGNKSPTGERYEFFEVHKDGEKPCVERQIVSEINQRVEEILGLTQNQFSQIVMLPQGEFRKLLTSETDNKEEILRRIFKTEPYKMISERLKQKRDAAKDAYGLEEQVLNSHLRSIESSLPQRDSELFEVLGREQRNIHQILSALQLETAFYKAKIADDKIQHETLYKNHQEKLDSFHEAKKWNGRFDEKLEKERRYNALTEQLPAIAEKEKAVQQAERAGFIANIENLYRELVTNEMDKHKLLERAVDEQQQSEEAKLAAEEKFLEQQGRSDERSTAQDRVLRLQQLLPQVQELAAKEEEVAVLSSAVKVAERRFQAIEKQLADIKEQKTAAAGKVSELEKQTDSFDSKPEELRVAEDRLRIAGELLAVQTEVKAQQAVRDQKEEVYSEALTKYKLIEESWFANQAHLLAVQLKDGEACPVCGSHEHPVKHQGASETAVSKEQLDQEKSRLDALDNAYRNASARLVSLEEQESRKKTEAEERGITDAEKDSALLKQDKQQLQEDVQTLQRWKTELREWKTKLADGVKETETAEQDRSLLLTEMNEKKSSAESAKAVLAEKLASIPEEMRSLAVLEQEIRQAITKRDDMERAWAAAQELFQGAKERLASAAMALQHSKTTAEEMTAKRQKAEAEFKQALEKSEFETEEAYQRAKMRDSEIEEMKQQITRFNQDRHTLQQQISELTELLAGRKNEDLSLAEAELEQLKSDYEQALSQLNHSKDCCVKGEVLIEQINGAVEGAAKAEAEWNRVADLHDMIRGQNSLKISFERYLQIEYLEQIIQAANERLRNLSNGQFYLIRSDRQEARGKQSGLGLDVYDSYTGQTRDVKTLSGGEKFNASLCLALGMADVIQSFQGNVSIDTMFIDEGFGSLDEESLNKSIETLIDLQRSGRMIGVISHVQELKAAIPAILEVRKSKEGFSKTSFHIK